MTSGEYTRHIDWSLTVARWRIRQAAAGAVPHFRSQVARSSTATYAAEPPILSVKATHVAVSVVPA